MEFNRVYKGLLEPPDTTGTLRAIECIHLFSGNSLEAFGLIYFWSYLEHQTTGDKPVSSIFGRLRGTRHLNTGSKYKCGAKCRFIGHNPAASRHQDSF